MADQTRFNGVVAFNGATTKSAAVSCTSTANASGRFTLGDTAQAAGVLTSKLNSGVLNMRVKTCPAFPSTHSAGAHQLTHTDLARGYCVVTANGGSTAITMPTKANMLTLFGSDIKVGDSVEWSLHNAATNVAHIAVLTAGEQTIPSDHQSVRVAANSADNSSSTVQGTSTARFLTRVTVTDGTTVTVRIA